MSYSIKQITLTIQLGQGSFGASGSNTVTLENLRIAADLFFAVRSSALGIITNQAMVRVWGLTLDQINQLTRAGTQWNGVFNTLIVSAGDNAGMAQVFAGDIVDAFPDFEQPDSPFVFSAYDGRMISLKPVAPSSYSGGTDAATVLSSLASQAGLGFENNGVTTQLASPYFPGTVGQQIASCAYAAGAYAAIDGPAGVLAIWPKTGSRGATIPLISPQAGMIGYPKFQQNQITVRTLFNTEILIGSQVQVQSQLTAACGTFKLSSVDHHISSQLPNGPWETVFTAYPADAATSS